IVAVGFEKVGCEVFTAENGNAAYDIVCSRKIDAIVTDIRMPDGNGIDLLNKIKTIDVFKPVLVFMSGYSDVSLEKVYDLGADGIFSKPFYRKEVVERAMEKLIPMEARWSLRPAQSFETRTKLDFEFPSLEE